MDQWMWMMNYCQKQRIPPAQTWAWEEAKKAYEEMMKELKIVVKESGLLK